MKLIDRAAQLAFSGAIALPKELNTKEKVGAVILYGLELGLAPMSALKHLYIVNGKVQPSTEVMAGLLLSRHPDARLLVEELTNERCVMRLIWPSRQVNDTYIVTWEDIKRAGLDKNEVAQKYPQDRLRYHATKRLLRIYAPDVINGLDQGSPVIDPEATPEDEEAIDDAELWNPGDVIQGEARLVEEQAGVEDVPTATPEQRALFKDWYEAIEDRFGKDTLKEVAAFAKTRWPYADLEGVFRPALLTAYDADAFIDLLSEVGGTGKLPEQVRAL
jgi:hypothetical protein